MTSPQSSFEIHFDSDENLTSSKWKKKIVRDSSRSDTHTVFLHVPFSSLFVLEVTRELEALFSELRAENIGFLFLLKSSPALSSAHFKEALFDKKREELLSLLFRWDQCLLTNLLFLLGDVLPPSFLKELKIEATFESTWFREWVVALSDPRIHLYPNLPWRSFIRKINRENYQFAQTYLLLLDTPEAEELVLNFLQGKKKVINRFPKKWKEKTR